MQASSCGWQYRRGANLLARSGTTRFATARASRANTRRRMSMRYQRSAPSPSVPLDRARCSKGRPRMTVPYALRRAMIRNECNGAAWVADRSWHPEKVAGLYAEAMAGNADPACSLFHDLRGHGHEVDLLLHVAAESKARPHLAPVLRAALVTVWNHAGMGLLMQEL